MNGQLKKKTCKIVIVPFFGMFLLGNIHAAEESSSVLLRLAPRVGSSLPSIEAIRADISTFANRARDLPSEEQERLLNTILSQECVREHKAYMPALLNSLLEAGISLESRKNQVGDILKSCGAPRTWRYQRIGTYWPYDWPLYFSEALKIGHWLQMRSLLEEKENSRLSLQEIEVLQTGVPLLPGDLRLKAVCLLSRDTDQRPPESSHVPPEHPRSLAVPSNQPTAGGGFSGVVLQDSELEEAGRAEREREESEAVENQGRTAELGIGFDDDENYESTWDESDTVMADQEDVDDE